MLSIAHIVIDPKLADALLYLFSAIATLALVYLVRTYRLQNGQKPSPRPARLGVVVAFCVRLADMDYSPYSGRCQKINPIVSKYF